MGLIAIHNKIRDHENTMQRKSSYIILGIASMLFVGTIPFYLDAYQHVQAGDLSDLTWFTDKVGLTKQIDLQTAMAQSSLTNTIPDGERMFTAAQADIKRAEVDPLIVEMVHVPKALVAGQPSTFVLNLFHKDGITWLWHSDFHVTVTKATTGQMVLVMPNIHGHGSMAQFTYIFPSSGVYDISMIFGQQTDSPNYVSPKLVREAMFTVTVEPAPSPVVSQAAATMATPVKEFKISVASWAFFPDTIEVDKGDLVRLIFSTVQDEISLYNGHGFGIDGYNVNVFLVKGATQTVEFVADKAGTFTFRCTSFCAIPEGAAADHFGMTGTFTVRGV